MTEKHSSAKTPEDQSFEEVREINIGDIIRFVLDYLARMRTCFPVFFVILSAFVFLWALIYIFIPPTYTATATIGPPNPSPIASLIANMGAPGIGGGMAKKLLGAAGGGGSTNDPFQEYQQLLVSPRLIVELTQTKGFLPLVFSDQWDAAANKWEDTSLVHDVAAVVKRLLQRPVKDQPDAVSLAEFLQLNFSVNQAADAGTTGVASLASLGGNNYLTLSLDAKNPDKAEKILDTILAKTDDLIRQEQLRDVVARIAYIENELKRVTEADQRDALIQTLASQEQLKVMMVADKRFAYVLVSTPYASPVPTWPTTPGKAVALSVFLSLVLWGVLVAFETKSAFVERHLRRFRWPLKLFRRKHA
jgi:hypothetical protein